MSGYDWRRQRKAGIAAIAVAMIVASGIWFGIRLLAPPLSEMEDVGARMLVALNWCVVAALFTLAVGVEAVAHERLQSPAFDPLQHHSTRRLEVNQRYLQNTLEQFVVFAIGLFGLAAYSPDGGSMRAVPATAVVWILARWAFWIGYHRSAALRGLGAPGLLLGVMLLIYVAARGAYDWGGAPGAAAVVVGYLAFEALLFWSTRAKREDG